MKVIILNSYFDKGLKRQIEVDEILDLDEDRIKVLKSIGVEVKECSDEDLDDEDLNDDLDEDRIDNLLELYADNRNVVDGLKADDLKLLCEHFDINYTNVSDAKTSLKIVTIS